MPAGVLGSRTSADTTILSTPATQSDAPLLLWPRWIVSVLPSADVHYTVGEALERERAFGIEIVMEISFGGDVVLPECSFGALGVQVNSSSYVAEFIPYHTLQHTHFSIMTDSN